MIVLHGLTSIDALPALRTGKHQPLDVSRFEAHRAGVVTEGRAICAVAGAFPLIAYHHRLAVRHPRQTLKHPRRTGVAAEQMPGKGEFQKQEKGGYADEQRLVAG